MAKIVEKWAAGFWCDRLYVAKGHFKETKKQLRLEGGSHGDQLDNALTCGTVFPLDTDFLHDTKEQALNALYARETQNIRSLQIKIDRSQGRINIIGDFEIST